MTDLHTATPFVALVVDDEPANREFMGRLYQTAGPTVHLAECRQSAEQCARSLPRLDLAIIDFQLPDGTGLDLVKALRALHPDCTIVMATVDDQRDLIDQAFTSGVDTFLVKPDGFLELYRLLLVKPINLAALKRKIVDCYGPRAYRGPRCTGPLVTDAQTH